MNVGARASANGTRCFRAKITTKCRWFILEFSSGDGATREVAENNRRTYKGISD